MYLTSIVFHICHPVFQMRTVKLRSLLIGQRHEELGNNSLSFGIKITDCKRLPVDFLFGEGNG